MTNFIKRILCYADLIHDYRIKKVLSMDAVKCECMTCGKVVAYNHNMQYCIPWDNNIAKFYDDLAKYSIEEQSIKEESDYIKLKSNYL